MYYKSDDDEMFMKSRKHANTQSIRGKLRDKNAFHSINRFDVIEVLLFYTRPKCVKIQ